MFVVYVDGEIRKNDNNVEWSKFTTDWMCRATDHYICVTRSWPGLLVSVVLKDGDIFKCRYTFERLGVFILKYNYLGIDTAERYCDDKLTRYYLYNYKNDVSKDCVAAIPYLLKLVKTHFAVGDMDLVDHIMRQGPKSSKN